MCKQYGIIVVIHGFCGIVNDYVYDGIPYNQIAVSVRGAVARMPIKQSNNKGPISFPYCDFITDDGINLRWLYPDSELTYKYKLINKPYFKLNNYELAKILEVFNKFKIDAANGQYMFFECNICSDWYYWPFNHNLHLAVHGCRDSD